MKIDSILQESPRFWLVDMVHEDARAYTLLMLILKNKIALWRQIYLSQ